MLGTARNRFRFKEGDKNWIFQPVDREPGTYEFDCGDEDISHFFLNEAHIYEGLLFCKTYELTTDEIIAESLPPLAFISYCNHTAEIKKNVEKTVPLPGGKPLKEYPAVKIAKLGVSSDSQKMGVGTDLLNITKILFASPENRTGCRILTVDAQNTERAIKLYRRGGFIFVNDKNTPETNPLPALIPDVP